jgi:hypothetical protein
MVSKCANPACSERFLYLHQGKLFNLTPTPEVEAAGGGFVPALYERFWLCDECCKRMTLVWGGTEVKLVPFPHDAVTESAKASADPPSNHRPKKRSASAGLHWR